MKLTKVKTEKPLETSNNNSLNIQYYGENNDFPQKIRNIVANSVTGCSCVSIFSKFINGQGFKEKDNLYRYIVNSKRQTLDNILKKVCQDYAQFYGFALHFNYNSNYKICEIQHIPFEQVRFEALDDNNSFSRVAIHWDWCKENRRLKPFDTSDIQYIDLFNPDPSYLQEQFELCGGVENYNGQVMYFTSTGEVTYPIPLFMPAITDMSTEQGLSNIDYRNARNRFMAGGMLVEIGNDNENTDRESIIREVENGELDSRRANQLLRELYNSSGSINEDILSQFQGDENAQKILLSRVRNKEEIPVFIPFTTNNYDAEYSVTKDSVKDRIGRVFLQPPILRGEDIGAGFGADLLFNAYEYYNAVTSGERQDVERAFDEIFSYWWTESPSNDFSIIPLKWNQTINNNVNNN